MAEENPLFGRLWSAMEKVVREGFASFCYERHDMLSAALGSA
jgi:hypothetical protein